MAKLILRPTSSTPAPGDQTPVTASSVTFDGVTFNFSEAVDIYEDSDGAPIVIGPVSITSTTPAWDGTSNGSCMDWNLHSGVSEQVSYGMNLGPTSQGFDNATWTVSQSIGYSASLNRDPGRVGSNVTVNEGTFIKSISKSNPADPPRPSVDRYVPLTVLPSSTTSVPVGALRPAGSAATKEIKWTLSDCADVDDFFPNLANVSGNDTFANYYAMLRRIRPMQFLYGDHGRRLWATDHLGPAYRGDRRGAASQWADAALLMCTDGATATEKENLRNAFVSQGIEVFERYSLTGSSGTVGVAEGGALSGGDKICLVMAAMFLDDQDMKDLAADNSIWHEDRQIGYVEASHVGLPDSGFSGWAPYQTGDIGTPEWGEQWTRQPDRSARSLSGDKIYRTYRAANGGIFGVAAIGHLVPEFRAIWDHEALWDYCDRRTYFFQNFPDTVNCPTTYARNMFSTYRETYGTTRVWGPGTSESDWSN